MTHTQAILSYVAPDLNPCTIEVSESPSFSPVVHDVNPTLFTGANSDAGRSLVAGRQRIVVIGRRNSDLASDGKLYSRALAADTPHYVRVTCGAQQQTTHLVTKAPAWGETSSEPPPYNPNGFGFYGWPTIDWTPAGRDKEYVDPMTGVKLKLLGWPGYHAPRQGEANVAADLWWDWQGAWTNPANIVSGGTSSLASSSTANAAIFVGVEPNPGVGLAYESGGIGNYGRHVDTVDDIGLRIFGSGTDSSAANRQIQVCLSMDSGQTCYSPTITVTLPQGSAVDNGIFPTSFPTPMFASWGMKPLKRGEDWPRGEGTVNVSGSTVTITNPNNQRRFLTSWPAGTKIWISGSNPICPRNLCTITSVQSDTQLTIQENLTLTGATFKALNFGYRIWKTTSTGTVSLSVKKAIAGSAMTLMWAGGDHAVCSPVETTSTVDRDGNPLPRPKKGRLCIPLRVDGAREAWAPVVWVAEDGEVRLISLHRFPTSISGHLPEDNPWSGAIGPTSLYARFDPNDGRVWYQALPTNGTDAFGARKQSIFKITYTGDFREYKPGYTACGSACAPADNTSWENITKASQGRDIQTQIINSNTPGYDRTKFGPISDMRSSESGVFHFGSDPGGQDGVCWTALFDFSGNLIKVFNSWDGRVYPELRWGACHSRSVDTTLGFDTQFTTNGSGPALYNSSRLLGGPFEARVTAVKRASGWDTANTAVSGTINDGSYDAACPPDLDPRWQAKGGTGNNCLTIRTQGELCSNYATANEKVWWPCPWDANRSTLAGNVLQEGDYLMDRAVAESERFLVARVTAVGQERELVLVRNVQDVVDTISPPRCGSNTTKRTHANGWSVSASQSRVCAGGAFFVEVNGTNLYVDNLTGHADTGLPFSGEITRANPFSARSGPPSYVLSTSVSRDVFFQGSTAGFDGVGGIGGGLQSYPSLSHNQAQGANRNWIMDNHHIEILGNYTMTQVSGQTYTWKITVRGNVDIKRLGLVAWVSHYLLRDISGPNSQISDATPWTFCYAYRAGECVAGSAAGEAFVSAPIIKTASTACPGFDAFGSYSGSPCVVSGGAFMSYTVQALLKGPAKGLKRKITMALSGHNRQGQFARSDPLADGTWARVPGYWLDGVRSDFLLAKMPSAEPVDGIDRTRFQQISVQVPPHPGATQAVIDFGYEEFGSRTDFHCTSRKEHCTVPGLTPFSFASEAISPAPCSSGCTITIPALPQKILYWRVRWLDAAGSTVGSGPLQAVATP